MLSTDNVIEKYSATRSRYYGHTVYRCERSAPGGAPAQNWRYGFAFHLNFSSNAAFAKTTGSGSSLTSIKRVHITIGEKM